MTFVEGAVTFLIIGFMILITWARIERKKLLDVLTEIRDLIKESIPREPIDE